MDQVYTPSLGEGRAPLPQAPKQNQPPPPQTRRVYKVGASPPIPSLKLGPVLPDEETAVLLLPAQSRDLDLKTILGAAILKAHCLCHLDPWKWKLLEPGSPCSSLPIHPAKVKYTQLMVREAGNLRFDL